MDIETVRNIIIEEIKKTEESIDEYKVLVQPIAPDNAYGRISRMDAIVRKSVSEELLRKAEERLSKLKTIETTIDTKDFGLCKRCKNPIPIMRILMVPESPYCINCVR